LSASSRECSGSQRFIFPFPAGGAAGGIFVAVIAPKVFQFFTEFQISVAASIVLLLCCLYLDSESWIFECGAWLPSSIVAGFIIAAYAATHWITPLSQFLDQFQFYPATLLVGALVLL